MVGWGGGGGGRGFYFLSLEAAKGSSAGGETSRGKVVEVSRRSFSVTTRRTKCPPPPPFPPTHPPPKKSVFVLGNAKSVLPPACARGCIPLALSPHTWHTLPELIASLRGRRGARQREREKGLVLLLGPVSLQGESFQILPPMWLLVFTLMTPPTAPPPSSSPSSSSSAFYPTTFPGFGAAASPASCNSASC